MQSDTDLVIDNHGKLVNINFCGLLEDATEVLKNIDLLKTVEKKITEIS